MARLNLCLFIRLFPISLAAIIPPNPAVTNPPVPVPANIQKREPWPASLLSLIPQKVDERFFSIDGNGNTQVLSGIDHFSTVSVIVSRRDENSPKSTTTARVGIHTATVGKDGTEYSFEVAPAVRELIKDAYHSASAAKREVNGNALVGRQGAPIMDPGLLGPAKAVANVLNAEAGPSLLGVAMEGATLPEVVAPGALPAAEAGLSTLTIAGGATVYVSFVASLSWAWVGLLKGLSSTPQLDIPHAVVINLNDLPKPEQCSGGPTSCSAETCKGMNSICTVGPRCPCEEQPTQCSNREDEVEDCADCEGEDGKCTTESKTGCSCITLLDQIFQDGYSDGEGFFTQLWDAWDQFFAEDDQNRGQPSGNPTCAMRGDRNEDLHGFGVPSYLVTDKTQKPPKSILYDMRHVMCNNLCEVPEGIPAKSSKVEKAGSSGCELSVLMSSQIEAYVIRYGSVEGPVVNDCWASFGNMTEKCFEAPNVMGWVEGPDEGEKFEMGYRPKNSPGKLHGDFKDGDEMQQYCGPEPPVCDTCSGGANNNHCSTGDYAGCACTPPASVTQPSPPKATNCASAVTAALITCCGWSQDTQKVCAQKMEGCGAVPRLDITCMSPVPADGSTTFQSPCAQSQIGDPIVWGSHSQDIAQCLVREFSLPADLQFTGI